MGVHDQVPILDVHKYEQKGKGGRGGTNSANPLRGIGGVLPESVEGRLRQLDGHQALGEESFVLQNRLVTRRYKWQRRECKSLRYRNS